MPGSSSTGPAAADPAQAGDRVQGIAPVGAAGVTLLLGCPAERLVVRQVAWLSQLIRRGDHRSVQALEADIRLGESLE